MISTESVTEWVAGLKQGDSLAAQKLWERYVGQLARLARDRLGHTSRRVADEEDVVVAAFASFCRSAEAGRFARLDDRNDLWQILVLLTERKAVDQIRHEQAEKRGAGDVRGESALARSAASTNGPPGIEAVVGNEPTPEFAAQVTDEFERMLAKLGDDELRQIALAKMEGYTNQEIASRTDLTLRTVERRLSLIRRLWEEDVQND